MGTAEESPGARAAESSGGTVWRGLAAGALSGVASRFVVYPFDTLKSQLQLQGGLTGSTARYAGLSDAVRQVGLPSKTMTNTFVSVSPVTSQLVPLLYMMYFPL